MSPPATGSASAPHAAAHRAPARLGLAQRGCRAAAAGLVAVALSALPRLALAAGEPAGNPWLDLLWKAINLIVLVGLIVYFARRPVVVALRGMAREAFDRWSGAHRLAARAEAEMAAQRQQIEGLAGELQRMVADAHTDAQRESARLVQEARAQAGRIVELARMQVEQEVSKARVELQRQIAGDTLRLAEQIVREQATPEQRRKLLDSYIRELEARQ